MKRLLIFCALVVLVTLPARADVPPPIDVTAPEKVAWVVKNSWNVRLGINGRYFLELHKGKLLVQNAEYNGWTSADNIPFTAATATEKKKPDLTVNEGAVLEILSARVGAFTYDDGKLYQYVYLRVQPQENGTPPMWIIFALHEAAGTEGA